MPADRAEQITKLASGRWRLRYYDRQGVRHSGGVHDTKSAARAHYDDVVKPELDGAPVARRDLTLQELADTFLERHQAVASKRTVQTLRGRLTRPLKKFGDVPLADLERMTDELAGFASGLPERYRYAIVSALRQTCEAGVRYGYMTRNPAKLAGKNPQPAPRGVRIYTAAELNAICEELGTAEAAAVRFAAATGLRPAEWAAVERRDVDRARRVLTVRGTKTARSRREVPLTTVALEAVDSLPARLDSPYVFGPIRRQRDESGQLVKQPFDVANFRRRDWGPAVEAAGVARPARIYDLRSTFASNALAAGITTFELARIMGTSVGMIEAHYGALIDTAHESLLSRLEGLGHVRATVEAADA